LGLALALATSVAVAPNASAYDKYGAAAYADAWALGRNRAYPSFGSDCTNFVSQALVGGGFSMVGYPKSTTDDHNWWVAPHYWWWDWTYSWSSASHLRQVLIWHVPGGYSQGQASGSSASTWTPSSVVTGDVLFYDWGGGEGISHASMQVGWGTDPNSGWYGNYVDQHTTDRRHAFWSLRPYNSQMASTTTVYFMT